MIKGETFIGLDRGSGVITKARIVLVCPSSCGVQSRERIEVEVLVFDGVMADPHGRGKEVLLETLEIRRGRKECRLIATLSEPCEERLERGRRDRGKVESDNEFVAVAEDGNDEAAAIGGQHRRWKDGREMETFVDGVNNTLCVVGLDIGRDGDCGEVRADHEAETRQEDGLGGGRGRDLMLDHDLCALVVRKSRVFDPEGGGALRSL